MPASIHGATGMNGTSGENPSPVFPLDMLLKC